jgi:hypothetical protein
MSGVAWIMVIAISVVASVLVICAVALAVVAFLFGTTSRLFANDNDQ